MAVKLNTFHLETSFGSRSLLRDNWLCKRIIKDLRRHETMTEEEIDALRMVSLHRTLVSAISKLPYYSQIPNRFPVTRSVEVLHRHFPIISKETLLENRDKLYPNAGKPRPWNSIGKTSGTTGTPLSVFRKALGVGRVSARHAACDAPRRNDRAFGSYRSTVLVLESVQQPASDFFPTSQGCLRGCNHRRIGAVFSSDVASVSVDRIYPRPAHGTPESPS